MVRQLGGSGVATTHQRFFHIAKKSSPKILITGGLGQLGTECAKLLRGTYGEDSVILSDIIKPSEEIVNSGPYIFADILDFKGLQKIVVDHRSIGSFTFRHC